MSRLDVDYRLSLNYSSKYVAYWNINKDFGRITFYLPNIWDIATDHSLFIEHDHPEECIENFIDFLILNELIERICLERAHQKIKLHGRTRCKPNCCVRRVALAMHDPDWFLKHRQLYPVNKPDYMDRGVDSSTFAKIG